MSEIIAYKGIPIEELNRTELLEALNHAVVLNRNLHNRLAGVHELHSLKYKPRTFIGKILLGGR